MKRFSKFITLPFVALVFFMSVHYANAETVLIEGAGQSKGQGWLFGSPQDASCWVVTPAHVVRAGKTGMVSDFIWRDIDGRQGSGVSAFIPKGQTEPVGVARFRINNILDMRVFEKDKPVENTASEQAGQSNNDIDGPIPFDPR